MQKRLIEIEEELAQIESRSGEINTAVETAEHDELEKLSAEVTEMEQRKAELLAEKAELEAKEEEARSFDESKATEIELPDEKLEQEERKMFGIETKEYRDAFMANLVGNATPEQRAILADNTTYGDGLALPTALDERIWDQAISAHPILGDVATLRTGMAIKVTKITPAPITKKKDSDPNTEATFTSVEVVLVGADYHTYVTLSFAEAKMSQGAMEDFLVQEIADVIGEALAKDIFARIIADAGTAQKVTATADTFADVKAALALATLASAPVIYAPAVSYYEIVGAIKSGAPFNMGAALGCQVKLDNAATGITVVDPKLFVLNVVQETVVEAQRDVKEAAFIIGGYMRAEGCLRKTKAAAYVA